MQRYKENRLTCADAHSIYSDTKQDFSVQRSGVDARVPYKDVSIEAFDQSMQQQNAEIKLNKDLELSTQQNLRRWNSNDELDDERHVSIHAKNNPVEIAKKRVSGCTGQEVDVNGLLMFRFVPPTPIGRGRWEKGCHVNEAISSHTSGKSTSLVAPSSAFNQKDLARKGLSVRKPTVPQICRCDSTEAFTVPHTERANESENEADMGYSGGCVEVVEEQQDITKSSLIPCPDLPKNGTPDVESLVHHTSFCDKAELAIVPSTCSTSPAPCEPQLVDKTPLGRRTRRNSLTHVSHQSSAAIEIDRHVPIQSCETNHMNDEMPKRSRFVRRNSLMSIGGGHAEEKTIETNGTVKATGRRALLSRLGSLSNLNHGQSFRLRNNTETTHGLQHENKGSTEVIGRRPLFSRLGSLSNLNQESHINGVDPSTDATKGPSMDVEIAEPPVHKMRGRRNSLMHVGHQHSPEFSNKHEKLASRNDNISRARVARRGSMPNCHFNTVATGLEDRQTTPDGRESIYPKKLENPREKLRRSNSMILLDPLQRTDTDLNIVTKVQERRSILARLGSLSNLMVSNEDPTELENDDEEDALHVAGVEQSNKRQIAILHFESPSKAQLPYRRTLSAVFSPVEEFKKISSSDHALQREKPKLVRTSTMKSLYRQSSLDKPVKDCNAETSPEGKHRPNQRNDTKECSETSQRVSSEQTTIPVFIIISSVGLNRNNCFISPAKTGREKSKTTVDADCRKQSESSRQCVDISQKQSRLANMIRSQRGQKPQPWEYLEDSGEFFFPVSLLEPIQGEHEPPRKETENESTLVDEGTEQCQESGTTERACVDTVGESTLKSFDLGKPVEAGQFEDYCLSVDAPRNQNDEICGTEEDMCLLFESEDPAVKSGLKHNLDIDKSIERPLFDETSGGVLELLNDSSVLESSWNDQLGMSMPYLSNEPDVQAKVNLNQTDQTEKSYTGNTTTETRTLVNPRRNELLLCDDALDDTERTDDIYLETSYVESTAPNIPSFTLRYPFSNNEDADTVGSNDLIFSSQPKHASTSPTEVCGINAAPIQTLPPIGVSFDHGQQDGTNQSKCRIVDL